MRQAGGTEAALKDHRPGRFITGDTLGEAARLLIGPQALIRWNDPLPCGFVRLCHYWRPRRTAATASWSHGSICRSRIFSEASRNLTPQFAHIKRVSAYPAISSTVSFSSQSAEGRRQIWHVSVSIVTRFLAGPPLGTCQLRLQCFHLGQGACRSDSICGYSATRSEQNTVAYSIQCKTALIRPRPPC